MMRRYQVTSEGWVNDAYRRAGEEVLLSQEQAKYLQLNGQVAPAEGIRAAALQTGPALAEAPRRNPFDHDGSGREGGSLPARELRLDLTALELAAKAEKNEIDFNTLRVNARRFLGAETPLRKAEIVAALRAHAAESNEEA